MKRRTFLTRTALAASTVALSGCTEETLKTAESQPPLFEDVYDEAAVELPVKRKFDVAVDGVRQADGATVTDLDAFHGFLEEREIVVEGLHETVVEGESVLELEYVDQYVVDRGLMDDLGRISGGYAALVAGGYTADTLDAVIVDAEGNEFGTFEIETAWAEAYLDGGLSTAEYVGRVADTMESSA